METGSNRIYIQNKIAQNLKPNCSEHLLFMSIPLHLPLAHLVKNSDRPTELRLKISIRSECCWHPLTEFYLFFISLFYEAIENNTLLQWWNVIGKSNDAEQKMKDFKSSERAKVTSLPAVMEQILSNCDTLDTTRSSIHQPREVLTAPTLWKLKRQAFYFVSDMDINHNPT